MYDLESSILIKPAIEPENEEDDYILYDVTWVSDTEVALISTNRVQNKSVTTRCKLDGKCEQEVIYSYLTYFTVFYFNNFMTKYDSG